MSLGLPIDADLATVKYSLNKVASVADIKIYRRRRLATDVLVETRAGTCLRGVNTVSCWEIDTELAGAHYAEVNATGIDGSDVDDEDSAAESILRKDFYTAEVDTSLNSADVGNIWEYEATVDSLLESAGLSTIWTIGAQYVSRYFTGATTIWGAIAGGIASEVFEVAMADTPAWMVNPSGAGTTGNWVAYYGEWLVRCWWWEDGIADYNNGPTHIVPGAGAGYWYVRCCEIWSGTIVVWPPPSGVVPIDTLFQNDVTGRVFSESEMQVTPYESGYSFDSYGLIGPDRTPVAAPPPPLPGLP